MTLIYDAKLAGNADSDYWVLIDGDKIAQVGKGLDNAPKTADTEMVDAKGMLLMPGAIDCHVHFREPGLTHKADIRSESRAAVAGGVTSYIDMPNTKPATTTIAEWQKKCEIAERDSLANYAFFIGATNDNIDELRAADYTKVAGVKLFMGSSTGNMLVDQSDAIAKIFNDVDAIVAVHAEDQSIISANALRAKADYPQGVPMGMHSQIRSNEACFQSSKKAVELAKKYGRRLHICHLTTKEELSLLEGGEIEQKLITSEVSPHHLQWCDADYATKGSRIKMNPAVKSAADREALRQALRDGLIDMVATDHAPHLLSEKEGDALTAVSGAPLLQFSLPLMLSLMDEKRVEQTMCENPARVYRIKERGAIKAGNYADLVLVSESQPYKVADEMAVSKCGWTPLDGVELRHCVVKTWVNGKLAYDNGNFAAAPHSQPLIFERD